MPPRRKTPPPPSLPFEGGGSSSPLEPPQRPGSNLPEYTVSDLSRALKKTVEENYGLVRVRGELGECKYHSSGHLYLSLKDETSVLAAVCWRGQVSRLQIRPESGMEVVCTGKLTTYAGQSKYQLVVESMALAGEGALLKMLEERRRKLAAEGLFDAAHKKKLPFLPEVIGVISSPTGAVIRDIMHRLSDRFPRRVLLWPCAVQGENAAMQVTAALHGFEALDPSGPIPRPDVIIIARGGGSIEDLMPFHDETLVRAVAASPIPIISAVGHETDTTLIDYAADLRAPTPTAAAELAVPVRAALLENVLDLGKRLEVGLARLLSDRRDRLRLLMRALGDPKQVLMPLVQRLDEKAERLSLSIAGYERRLAARLAEAGAKLRHPRDLLKLALERLSALEARRKAALQAKILGAEKRLAAASRLRDPSDLLRLSVERLAALDARREKAARLILMNAEKKAERAGAMLQALSPRAVLRRGYGILYDEKGEPVLAAASLKKDQKIRIELYDGSREAKIED